MKISYANSRVRKICTDKHVAQKTLGKVCANILRIRLERIQYAANLEEMRNTPGHWHELTGDRWGQLACRLDGPTRIVFEPDHDPRPEKPDGGLDWLQVTSIIIIEITDYH
jgi:proteic killer suppression protein